MATHNSPGSHLVVSLLLFLAAAGIALLLLLTAAVVWLSEVLDSLIGSALLLGALFAVAAAAIYWIWVRKPLAHLRDRAETIYEVARIAKNAYDWVTDKLHWFRTLWSMGSE